MVQFSSPHIYVGDNTHIEAENLTVGSSPWTLENKGILKANQLNIERSLENDGAVKAQNLSSQGNITNIGEITVANTTQFKTTTFQQQGDFQTQTASGTIQTLKNLDKTSIQTADNLTILHVTIGKGSHFDQSEGLRLGNDRDASNFPSSK